ncbi:hypothetical protein ACFY93_15735 [Streptomyces sp. NPDC008313]|uniref:hypothetical protein n=1 Tax=Streptomyces sp. NPDC008313 TaxID=3364826 RepID=UPI0036E59795
MTRPTDADPAPAALEELLARTDGGGPSGWPEDHRSGLDAAALRVAPGAEADWSEDGTSDALVIVLDGSGALRTAAGRFDVTAHTAVWVPRGSGVRLSAADAGLFCAVVRTRRRAFVTLPAPSGGGEPACLLQQVCAECGRMATESDARYCNRCGSPLRD